MYPKTMSEVTLGACPSTMGRVAVGHSGILPARASVDTVSVPGRSGPFGILHRERLCFLKATGCTRPTMRCDRLRSVGLASLNQT